MKETYKIILVLACVCVVSIAALLGFGIWRITEPPSTTNDEQNNDIDVPESEGEGLDIILKDGSKVTIANPSMLEDFLNGGDVEIEWQPKE